MTAAATPVERAALVHTEIVQPQDGQASLTLTGEVQARFRADLSFRVSGRVIARLVDVGAHVNAGDLLARLDPAEQQADFDAATAGVAAAEAQLRVAQATFDRQTISHRLPASPPALPTTRRRSNCEPHKARLNRQKRSWERPARRLTIPNCTPARRV